MAEEPQRMETDAPTAPEEPKVHLPGEDSGFTTYPVALVTQEAVLEDQQLFTSILQDLNAKLQTAQPKKYRPSKYRVPTVAGRELSLHLLYKEVAKLGGAIALTADNKWMEVVAPFNFTGKFNLSAIRKIYSSLLWHFEQVYMHKAAGQKLLEPPELPASAAVDPALVDGISTRPSRNRRGTSLAAIIAAADNADSDSEAEAVAAAAGKQGTAAGKKADGSAAAKKEDSASAAKEASAGEKPAAAAGGRQQQQRKQQSQQPQQPQQRAGSSSGAAAAPGKTPELVGFLKAGKGRKDLTGQPVTGKVDARFDCGYFVSLTIAGQSFNGILYCPTAMAAAAAAGQAAGAKAAAAAGKREEDGGKKVMLNGSAMKREAGAAGVEGDGGRGGKRRRSQPLPDSASKPKSAKTAFNFFAAEQWPIVKAELGANAMPQDISRAVGEKWNRATDAERVPYVNKAQEDKNRFDKEMEGWKAGLESPGATAGGAAVDGEAVGTPTAAIKAAVAGGLGTPGKPPIGKGLFTAGGGAAGGGEAMDVDGAAGDAAGVQQQHKHKLKFKLSSVGSVKPADCQLNHAADGAAGEQPAAVAVGATPAAVKQEQDGEAAAAAGAVGAPASELVAEAARHVAAVAPTAPGAADGDATPAAAALTVPVEVAAAPVEQQAAEGAGQQ